MKTFFLLSFFSFALLNATANVQFIPLPKNSLQPLSLKYESATKKIHVFCNGNDNNFNGFVDSNDVGPSWVILEEKDNQINSTVASTFGKRFFQFPLRLDFLDKNESFEPSVYIPFTNETNPDFSTKNPGYISSFDLVTKEVISANVTGFQANSVSHYGPHLLLTRNRPTMKGDVVVYDLSTNKPLQTINAEMNLLDAYAYTANGKLKLAAYSDNYTDSAWFHIALVPHMSDFSFTTKKTGKTPNHMLVTDKRIYLTLNGSHSVIIYNSANGDFIREVATGTTGFNGPREVVELPNNKFSVSTYNGEVIIFDSENFNLLQRVPTKINDITYNTESMVVAGNILYAASPYDNQYNKNNSGLFKIDLTTLGIDEFDNSESNSHVYPNPVRDYFNLKIDNIQSENYTIKVIDANGRILNEQTLPYYQINQTYNKANLGITSAGIYRLNVSSTNFNTTIPLVVIND
jgi:hypothetical protein